MIYLDNASTTQVDVNLKELIDKYLYENYGNAGSNHKFGIQTKKAIEIARRQISRSIKASPENVIFTSCGSEANTLAIVGLADHLKKHNLNHIITTKYEHRSVLNAMKEMENRGFDVTYLDVPNGFVQYDNFVSAVRDDTGLVSVMYINNELGTKNHIEPIYKFCKQREILFHSDCVQAVGTEAIELGVTADMITISGHKIHAPKGTGCLCTLYRDFLHNTIFGGQQEFGIRPGTENTAAIVALGQAMKNISENREQINTKIDVVSLAFGGRLRQMCEKYGINFKCNVSNHRITSRICSLRFENIDAETLVFMLGSQDVCVSAGAACSSISSEPSHVLKAIGLTDEQARSTIRVSFSEYNTVSEAHKAAEIVAECVFLLNSIEKEEL